MIISQNQKILDLKDTSEPLDQRFESILFSSFILSFFIHLNDKDISYCGVETRSMGSEIRPPELESRVCHLLGV